MARNRNRWEHEEFRLSLSLCIALVLTLVAPASWADDSPDSSPRPAQQQGFQTPPSIDPGTVIVLRAATTLRLSSAGTWLQTGEDGWAEWYKNGSYLGTSVWDVLANGGTSAVPSAYEGRCFPSGSNTNLTIYAPFDRYLPSPAFYQYIWNPYERGFARRVVYPGGEVDTKQFNFCVWGGADGDGGWRVHYDGSGTTHPDETVLRRIDWKFKTGAANATYDMDLSFQVSAGPVKITARQRNFAGTSRLRGGAASPVASLNTYERNAVNAWYEDACMDDLLGCNAFEGTSDWFGASHEGLWEFPQSVVSSTISWAVLTYVRFGCSNPLGCAPLHQVDRPICEPEC